MAHWKSMMDREFLFAFDLGGKDVTAKIEKVAAGTVLGEGGRKSKKPLVWFAGAEKPLALNSTNAKTIASMYGNETDAWIGRRVTLYPTTTEMGGQTVDCIRVRPRVPPDPPAKRAAPAASAPSQPVEPTAEREPGSDG